MSFNYSNPAGLSFYDLFNSLNNSVNTDSPTYAYTDRSPRDQYSRQSKNLPSYRGYLPRSTNAQPSRYIASSTPLRYVPYYSDASANNYLHHYDDDDFLPHLHTSDQGGYGYLPGRTNVLQPYRYAVPSYSRSRCGDNSVDIDQIVSQVLNSLYNIDEPAQPEDDETDAELSKASSVKDTTGESDAANENTTSSPSPEQSSKSGEKVASQQQNKDEGQGKDTRPTGRPSLKKAGTGVTKSFSKIHANAPSPITDPLQVSAPQLRTDLPFSPSIDLYDKPECYVAIVALPGGDKKSFRIDFHPSSHELIIKGEIKNTYALKHNHNSERYLKVSEQRFGAFERSIRFPSLPEINDESISARFDNGLLEVTVPKIVSAVQRKPKRSIEIEDVEDEELKREENGGWLK